VWATESTAAHRGDGPVAAGVVKPARRAAAHESQPVALLLNESSETLAIADRMGFRCFTAIEDFRRNVEKHILAEKIGP